MGGFIVVVLIAIPVLLRGQERSWSITLAHSNSEKNDRY